MRTREFAINESLKKCAPLVQTIGRAKWDFILNNGSMLLVKAQADDEWLHLQAALEIDAAHACDNWKLLQLNHQLDAGKFALSKGEETAHLRAEIPLEDEVDLQRRLLEACAGFKVAAGCLHGEKSKERAKLYPLIGPDEAGEQKSASELARICRDSGWQFTERSEGKLAVELEAVDGFYQAMIEEQPAGEVRVFVELARDESFGEWSRRALSAMLLRASGLVRFARAAISEDGGQEAALFEVMFQSLPSVVELSHALSALSIACRLCGREVTMLRDERIAKNYVSAQKLIKRLNN
jgi:hypothetical protein